MLTSWYLNKKANILQMTFQMHFLQYKCQFWFSFHRIFFPWAYLTIIKYWFKAMAWYLTGTRHYLIQCWRRFTAPCGVTNDNESIICHDKVQCWNVFCCGHGDVIKWKHFPRYWPFVREIHRSPVNSPHKGQWRGALMFSLIRRLNKRLSK